MDSFHGKLLDPQPEYCLCPNCDHLPPRPRKPGKRGKDRTKRKVRTDHATSPSSSAAPPMAGTPSQNMAAMRAHQASTTKQQGPPALSGLPDPASLQAELRQWLEQQGTAVGAEARLTSQVAMLDLPVYMRAAVGASVKNVESRVGQPSLPGVVLIRETLDDSTSHHPIVHKKHRPCFEHVLQFDPDRVREPHHRWPFSVVLVVWLEFVPQGDVAHLVWTDHLDSPNDQERVCTYLIRHVCELPPGLIVVDSASRVALLTPEEYTYVVMSLMGRRHDTLPHLEPFLREQALFKHTMSRASGQTTLGIISWLPEDRQTFFHLRYGQAASVQPSECPTRNPAQDSQQPPSSATLPDLHSYLEAVRVGSSCNIGHLVRGGGGGSLALCRAPVDPDDASGPVTTLAVKLGGQGFHTNSCAATKCAIVREGFVYQQMAKAYQSTPQGASATPSWLPTLFGGHSKGAHGRTSFKFIQGLAGLHLVSTSPSKHPAPPALPPLPDVICLATHFVHGSHLSFHGREGRYMLKGSWTSQDRLDIIISLLRVVAHLHALGFYHRDLKESNYVVTRQSRVSSSDSSDGRLSIVLLDFAGAHVANVSSSMERDWESFFSTFGTPDELLDNTLGVRGTLRDRSYDQSMRASKNKRTLNGVTCHALVAGCDASHWRRLSPNSDLFRVQTMPGEAHCRSFWAWWDMTSLFIQCVILAMKEDVMQRYCIIHRSLGEVPSEQPCFSWLQGGVNQELFQSHARALPGFPQRFTAIANVEDGLHHAWDRKDTGGGWQARRSPDSTDTCWDHSRITGRALTKLLQPPIVNQESSDVILSQVASDLETLRCC